MKAGPQGLGRNAKGIDALKQDKEGQSNKAKRKSDRRAGEKDKNGCNENDGSLRCRAHAVASPPNGRTRPVTSSKRSTIYCNVSTPSPIGIDP